jgi:predicted nucleotidyltransferase
MLGEFMGAINFKGEQYLNFLLRADRELREFQLKNLSRQAKPLPGVRVYAFGSFLRRRLHADIDLMIVYEEPADRSELEVFEARLQQFVRKRLGQPDVSIASAREFAALRLQHDNLTKVYP